MAAIFTFDPDPPQVLSPWSRIKATNCDDSVADLSNPDCKTHKSQIITEIIGSDGFMRLDPEPQIGPVEYKLHLLLRPRRSFLTSAVLPPIAPYLKASDDSVLQSQRSSARGSPAPSHSTGSRQHRFEQLTTQLLWRLQQSSPHHTSSTSKIVLPTLPDTSSEFWPPRVPVKLIQGLEESNGALYEIGVADDGTLVGLADDEITESLNNLKAMAASLGCTVDLRRRIAIGSCEWLEAASEEDSSTKRKQSKLWVAEAYIRPDLRPRNYEDCSSLSTTQSQRPHAEASNIMFANSSQQMTAEQLRVTVAGATTSGKSSLLGTLSTSTLDNGRGKSRLSLLKHRHEIESGLTSSVTQELIGYADRDAEALSLRPSECTGITARAQDDETDLWERHRKVDIINHASKDVSSWNDIHSMADPGRIVMLSDSAGHPRYRRTTVRGLIGWAPHWTLLCIGTGPASTLEGTWPTSEPDDDLQSSVMTNIKLSIAHLELCLRLRLRIVVALTKVELASRQHLRQVLSAVLTTLKGAGRVPFMMHNDNQLIDEKDLQQIPGLINASVQKNVRQFEKNDKSVPIIMTSAVRGTAVLTLHALLRHLPIASVEEKQASRTALRGQLSLPSSARNMQSEQKLLSHDQNILADGAIFHVEDVYNFSANTDRQRPGGNHNKSAIVVSGRLARGRLAIGQELRIGPFPSDSSQWDELEEPIQSGSENSPFFAPRSFDAAFARATSTSNSRVKAHEQEWRNVKVTSLRNLQLPVQAIEMDQVGTIGVIPVDSVAGPLRARKGMVLIDGEPMSSHTFTAAFDVADAPHVVVGSLVVVYTASVRASAKVIAAELQESNYPQEADKVSGDSMEFDIDDLDLQQDPSENVSVTFQFLTCREWIGQHSKVLVMPGGGPGLGRASNERGAKGFGSLDGYVGVITRTFG